MQRFVFSVVSSLWEMRRIEKVREKIKETFMTPRGTPMSMKMYGDKRAYGGYRQHNDGRRL